MSAVPARTADAANPRGADASETAPLGWGFLRSSRWAGYAALFLVFSVVCVLLGNWQFERRAEARAEIARIDANYDADALPLADAVPEPARFDEDARKWQTVRVTGRYEDEHFLVRNRPGQRGVGSHLIEPLRLANGTLFFVDRGWVPVDGTSGEQTGLPAPPSGDVTVLARVRASEPAISGRSTSGRSLASIDVPELARLSGAPHGSVTAAYGQLVEESPAAETGELPPRPARDEGPHLSYALQWYVFILIAASGIVYAARQEYRGWNAGSPQLLRQDARRSERKRHRAPSDDEEEDALLDG